MSNHVQPGATTNPNFKNQLPVDATKIVDSNSFGNNAGGNPAMLYTLLVIAVSYILFRLFGLFRQWRPLASEQSNPENEAENEIQKAQSTVSRLLRESSQKQESGLENNFHPVNF